MSVMNGCGRWILVLTMAISPLRLWAFEWPVATADEVNIDTAMLDELVERIHQGQYGAVRSLLVLRHGKLVREAYFNGFSPDDLMVMYSATKSLGSALIGIGVRRGDIPPLDSRIEDVFSLYSDVFDTNLPARNIRLRDILTQRHGFAWDEWSLPFTNPGNPVFQMTESADWWAFVLGRNVSAPRDTVFRYSTGASNLQGLAIYNQTGQSAEEYAVEHLFTPLDIRQWAVEVGLYDVPLGQGISQFQDGLTPTGHGFWMRARDLAKIGQLYLDRGVFDSHRILHPGWVDESWGDWSNHDTDPEVFPENVSYGYQWWTVTYQTSRGPVDVHRAWGWGGQYIFVIPDYDAVIVSTNGNFADASGDIRNAFPDLIMEGFGTAFDPLRDGGLTGPWVADAAPSQGFVIEVVPSTGQIVLFWMTFDPLTGEQMWILGESVLRGRRMIMTFRRPLDGAFFGGDPARLETWGEGEMVFTSCTTARLSYRSLVQNVEGAHDMRRLTPNVSCPDEPEVP